MIVRSGVSHSDVIWLFIVQRDFVSARASSFHYSILFTSHLIYTGHFGWSILYFSPRELPSRH